MSAGLALNEVTAPQFATTEPLTSLPSTFSERLSTAWKGEQTNDRYWNVNAARKTEEQKVSDDLFAATGKRYATSDVTRNPPTQEEMDEVNKTARASLNTSQRLDMIAANRKKKMSEAAAGARTSMADFAGPNDAPPGYLDPDTIDARIGQQSEVARTAAGELEGTGNGFGAFVGSSAGNMVSPHGIASMFIPVTRIPLATAEGIAGGFAGNVLKEALFQGTAQAGVQAVGTVIDNASRRATGTQQTLGEAAEDIGGAFVGGAVLGGVFRGTHLALRKLMAREPDLVPPQVKDAAQNIESAELYGKSKNALGLPAEVHANTLDRAVMEIARGRPASADELVPNLHEAVRADNPELFAKYDAAVARRDAARAVVAPTDEALESIKQKFDGLSARIETAAGDEQRQLRAEARATAAEYEKALERKDTLAKGEATETPETAAARQELMAADVEMRDMLSEVRKAYDEAGHGIAQTVAPGEDALVTAKMTPEEHARVTELQDNVASYQELMAKAPDAEKSAWQSAIDAANDELGDLMHTKPEQHPAIQRAVEQAAPSERTMLPEEERTAGRPQEDQIKAEDTQAKMLLEQGTTPELRARYKAIEQEEKEAKIATSCAMGAAG